jgi:DNA-binding response OmpR family regulator
VPPVVETPRSPRVLILLADQWPRALLRAALREAGYDAVGARGLPEALRYPADVPGRGPVRLMIVDQSVLRGVEDPLLVRLLGRHADPAVVLIAPATRPRVEGPWRRVIRRPATIEELVAAVQAILPLAATRSGPMD